MKPHQHIAILRGINVGGHRKIKMADLREKLLTLGFEQIRTYIQSGNILFCCLEKDQAKLEDSIQQLILTEYGFDVPVIVLSLDLLLNIKKQSPFLPAKETEIKKLYVTFLKTVPDPKLIAALSPTPFSPDDFQLGKKAIYLYFAISASKSKLTNNFFEKKLAVTATTRNWKTVKKLIELASI